MEQREGFIKSIEELGSRMRKEKRCEEWLAQSDPLVAQAQLLLACECLCSVRASLFPLQVSRTVNGPLMLALSEAVDFHDGEAVDQFRVGAHLVTPYPSLRSGLRARRSSIAS